MSDRSRETSREEDYRDYEERDLDEGWPYPDQDAARRKANEAYGVAPAGLEGDTNAGTEVADAPAIHSDGGPSLSRGIAHEAIDDDALEEKISNRFADRDDIDEDQITVTVQHGVAKLSGNVDTSAAAALVVRIVAAVPGVRGVYNLLVPVGIDSHIPGDATG
jgi:osmotically-inducible protein OsmY